MAPGTNLEFRPDLDVLNLKDSGPWPERTCQSTLMVFGQMVVSDLCFRMTMDKIDQRSRVTRFPTPESVKSPIKKKKITFFFLTALHPYSPSEVSSSLLRTHQTPEFLWLLQAVPLRITFPSPNCHPPTPAPDSGQWGWRRAERLHV